jgi:molybdopterin biosynthesis enzyme
VSGLATADGLAILPEGVDTVEEGEDVRVLLFDDAPAARPPVSP